MPRSQVLRQRNWTEEELVKAGFCYYTPTKRLVMARVIKKAVDIEMTLEVLRADSGDIVCYTPGDQVQPSLDGYDHWPVQPDLFKKTYKAWDDPMWRPNEPEKHLMLNGCKPYFKHLGVWALKLPVAIMMQSLESPEPVLVPAGRWLCIGSQGEPYHMSEENFHVRYQFPPLK